MVLDDLLDDLLGRLVVRDPLKGRVERHKDGDVGVGGVQQLDDVGEVVNEGRELLGEVRRLDCLIYGEVRRAVVDRRTMITGRTMAAGRAMVTRPTRWAVMIWGAVVALIRLPESEKVVGFTDVDKMVDMAIVAAGDDMVENVMCLLVDEIPSGLVRRVQRVPPGRFLGVLSRLLNLEAQLLGRRVIGDDNGRGQGRRKGQ